MSDATMQETLARFEAKDAEIAALRVEVERLTKRDANLERAIGEVEKERDAASEALDEARASLSKWIQAFGHLQAAAHPHLLVNVDDPAWMARESAAECARLREEGAALRETIRDVEGLAGRWRDHVSGGASDGWASCLRGLESVLAGHRALRPPPPSTTGGDKP